MDFNLDSAKGFLAMLIEICLLIIALAIALLVLASRNSFDTTAFASAGGIVLLLLGLFLFTEGLTLSTPISETLTTTQITYADTNTVITTADTNYSFNTLTVSNASFFLFQQMIFWLGLIITIASISHYTVFRRNYNG